MSEWCSRCDRERPPFGDCARDYPDKDCPNLDYVDIGGVRAPDAELTESAAKLLEGAKIHQSADGRSVYLIDANGRVWVPLSRYLRAVDTGRSRF